MRAVLLAVGWLATLAAAFVVGRTTGEDAARPASAPAAVERPAGTVPSVDPGPMLAPGATDATSVPAATPSPEAVTPDPFALKPGETLEPFTLEGVTEPGEAMNRLMRHVAALLAKGEEGHLELLRFLDESVVRNEELGTLFEGSEDQMARYLVPMVEFLVHRKGQVVGVIETVFETMAERPEELADIDGDTLEIFTEGAAVILPGTVDEPELARYRGWAHQLLATPEGSLPEPVEKQRRRLQQALRLWAPQLSREDALARLKAGELQGAEALQVLLRLSEAQQRELDLGRLLAPLVAAADYRALRALRDLPLQGRDLDLLDRTALDAIAAEKMQDWAVRQYLQGTRRARWPEPQAFLEEGLRRGGKTLETCALTLARLGAQVPTEYYRWVLDGYELSEEARTRLESRMAGPK